MPVSLSTDPGVRFVRRRILRRFVPSNTSNLHAGIEQRRHVYGRRRGLRQHAAAELALALQQGVQMSVEAVLPKSRVDGQRDVHLNHLSLADPVHPLRALVLDGRVPPAARMDDLVASRQRQSDSAGLWREQHSDCQ